jgi:hypothetical protein
MSKLTPFSYCVSKLTFQGIPFLVVEKILSKLVMSSFLVSYLNASNILLRNVQASFDSSTFRHYSISESVSDPSSHKEDFIISLSSYPKCLNIVQQVYYFIFCINTFYKVLNASKLTPFID